jgi:hypothetical protein
MDNSYYGTFRIQAIVPGKMHVRNLAEPGGRQAKDFKEAAIRGKWPLPSSMLHNVMIFMICTMGIWICTVGMKLDFQDGWMWILNNGSVR